MREVKAVVFDLDGTLTQSEEGIWNCVRHAVRCMGMEEPDAATLRKFVGPPLVYSFQEYLGMTEEEAWQATDFYRQRYNTVGLFENRVYPGIRRVLARLKKAGYYLAVATGKPQRPTEQILAHFGLDKFFDMVAGTRPEDATAGKAGLISRVLPAEYASAVMVGDTRFDMEGAQAVGIDSIGVGYGYGGEKELRSWRSCFAQTRRSCGEASFLWRAWTAAAKQRRWICWRIGWCATALMCAAPGSRGAAPLRRRFADCCLTRKTRR